jgi:polyisoprenoid-binding protein YceI
MKTTFATALLAASLLAGGCKKDHDVKLNRYTLEPASEVEWRGYKKDGQHHGAFSVTGQDLLVENGTLKSGSFTIPIASITNFDLPADMKPLLLEHLKSADFFNAALHPNASFAITKVSPLPGGKAGAVEGANYAVEGNFTLLDKTLPLTFPARITLTGGKLNAEAVLKIDRTKWGMTSYADPNGPLYIYPEVDLHLKLSGTRE